MIETERLLRKYFIEKTATTHIQFFRFIFVGGLAAMADMGIFFISNTYLFPDRYLLAHTLGFSIGVTTNYYLSIWWIFKSSKNQTKEFMLFTLFSGSGLILSYILMYVFIDILEIHYLQYMLAKTMTVALVLFWNFAMRKMFVFESSTS